MCTCGYYCATEIKQTVLAKNEPVSIVLRQDDQLARYHKQPDEEAAQHVGFEHVLTQLAELWAEQHDCHDSSLTCTVY
jgi:hypothetical protein